MMEKLKVLDLFSGIGGFSLGLERTGGFETVAFCEIEPFPRRVLAKHWPNVPCYHDVRELSAERLAADGIAVDVICGGFPCQDISTAGKGAGLAGERSGLWSEIARLVGELRPRFVIVENVAALLGRGLGDVLGDLAALRYDAEWHCIPASAVGAPHRRDRVWIIGYANLHVGQQCASLAIDYAAKQFNVKHGQSGSVANAISLGRQGQGQPFLASSQAPIINREAIDALASCVGNIWRVEPDVGRVANGIPDRSHRLKGLGNAVVPQIPELIGRAILAAMSRAAEPSRSGCDDCAAAIPQTAAAPFPDPTGERNV
jgi:DNA (cytosine-5)-methyltransferase 1